MRKCGSCGYLLFDDVDRCKHCGAAVEELTAVSGVAAAAAPPVPPRPVPLGPPATVPGLAPAPNGPSSSARPSMPLPQFPPPPLPSARAEMWRPEPPPAAPPRRKRSKARIVIPSVVLAITTGVVGTAMHAAKGSLPAGTSAFAKGDGVDYASPDGSYTTQFPKAPVASQDAVQVGQFSATLDSALVTTNDYEMATASIALPEAPTGSLATQLLNDALNTGVTKSGGEMQHQEQITRGGMPALHATFKAPDGYTAEAEVVLEGRWLFVLFVHAKTGTSKLYGALDKAFAVSALP